MRSVILATAGLIAALAAIGTVDDASPDSPAVDSAPAQLTRIGDMSTARAAHQATALLSGRVLVTGGCTAGCDATLRSTELYDPEARRFLPAAAMATARDSHIAIRLDDGRVLVAGGWSDGSATDTAELYGPDADRFLAAGSMTIARAASEAARLADGRVLVAGGQSSGFEPMALAEVFDSKTRRFSPTGSMSVPRVGHVAVALQDGRVLIVGGRQVRRGGILRSAEVFDPATGQFLATGDMSSPRHKHAAALLPDGRVLVIGGSDDRDSRGRYRSTEIYDPGTGKFSDGPDMRWPRFKLTDAVATLPSGAILVAGDATRIEIYDPVNQRFSTLQGELNVGRQFATASALPGGEVLVLGGYDDKIQTSASAWLARAP